MPNWCSNTLYIRGDADKVADFVQRVKLSPEMKEKRGQDYDILGSLYPTPEELTNTVSGFLGDEDKQKALEAQQQENIKKYGHKDWYDWNNAKWGTKWGDCDTFLHEGSDSVEFSFQSAWSPPIEGIAHISAMFPELRFVLSYYEDGMGYYGVTSFDGTGDYLDNCDEYDNIDGRREIDWDGETWEDDIQHNDELVMEAIEELVNECLRAISEEFSDTPL